MTKSGARKVLEEWAARVAGVSEETLGWRVWHHDFVEPFHAAILEVEPFSSLKFAWLFGPDDSGELLDTRLPRWLIQKLQSGTAPEKIIEQVEAEISENVSHLCDVTAIFGADIDAEVELKNGIKLIPSGRIPERWHDQKVQRPLNESWFDPHDC